MQHSEQRTNEDQFHDQHTTKWPLAMHSSPQTDRELPSDQDLYLVLSNDNKVLEISVACQRLLPSHLMLKNEPLEKVLPLINLSRHTPGWVPEKSNFKAINDQSTLLFIEPSESDNAAVPIDKKSVAIFEALNIGIMQLSSDYRCIYSNQAIAKITGLTAHELAGTNWLNMVHEQDLPLLQEAFQDFEMYPKQVICIELRIKKPLGEVRWLRVSLNNIAFENDFRVPLLQAEDITETKLIEKNRWDQQYIDHLTHLYNRQGIEKLLAHELRIAAKTGKYLFVYTLDLDCFKRVNDEFGHDAGDKLLLGVSANLKNHLPQDCIIGRVGGDVFSVVFVNQTNQNTAEALGHRIVKLVNTYYKVFGKAINISCSVGGVYEQPAKYAAYSDSNENTNFSYFSNRVLKQSDKALQKAKQRGRNQFRLLDKEIDSDTSLSYTILNDIPWSLRKSHFYMVYQPIVDSGTGQTVLMEALIRWRHPKLGLISPGQFIPLAESSGAMIPLGDWLLEQVFKEFGGLSAQQCANLSVSVNLSSYQLDDDDFFRKLERLEQRYELSPESVVFEITETVLVHDTEKTAACLKELSRKGYRLALDDFGTGYSSLSYLHQFDFDLLKIDKSFVQDMINSKAALLLVNNIVSLAHSLELPVIAEGVENREELDLLAGKCELLQGFYFAKPSPLASFGF